VELALKASSVSNRKNIFNARSAVTSTVVLTDFKINIGNIEFETDMEDDRYDMYPFHEDVKLTGPFLIDLLDPNNTCLNYFCKCSQCKI
jgi:hypothetical protein